jgi:transcription antitermination factor NusG
MHFMNEQWYAVYTRPRWEKKVAEILTSKSINNYCPLNRVVRQWSDRKKVVYEPLFTSYVFVHVSEKQHADLRKVDGIISLVYWLGKPAVIKDAEIEVIREFLNEYSNVQLEKAAVNVNDIVKVTKGPLMDREGSIVAVKTNTVKVALPSLGYVLYAELEKTSIEKITRNSIIDNDR